MDKQETAQDLRAKILGVLIRNARLVTGKELDDCAKWIHVTKAEMEAYELGEESLSLPELEVIAHFFEIPLDHFWGRELLSDHLLETKENDIANLLQIRTKIIGTLIRMGRLDTGYSLDEMADQVGITVQQLNSCEAGEIAIPLPVLETIASILNQPINQFQDKDGPLKVWSDLGKKTRDFQDLPTELQAFVSHPINRPYIELAQRLSEMPVEKLRKIAESILEITL